jgi:electron transfer flavoprotein beta subunit
MLNLLVCVKRVPATGARITLTEDEQAINTRYLGFTVSPHEECAVEEAIRQIETHGGQSTVLTLGPEEAADQLRDALAMGIDEAILLQTHVDDWGPMVTADALTDAIRNRQQEKGAFDFLLFGNESADNGGYQVGIRVAYALDLPCVTGIKGLEIQGNTAIARREASGGWEIFKVPLPAVFTVKEGINLPRYPSFKGKMSAKKKPMDRLSPDWKQDRLEKIRLESPVVETETANILGKGPEAAPQVVQMLKELGIV